jgi:hypothetical protein
MAPTMCTLIHVGRSFIAISSEDGHSYSKVKLALCLIKQHATNMYGSGDMVPPILMQALDENQFLYVQGHYNVPGTKF